jgi:hypothetical protein
MTGMMPPGHAFNSCGIVRPMLNKPTPYIEDLWAREEPILFPPVLHMGKLIPSDLEQCACLNKVYGAARRDPKAARCLKSNGLPVPKARHQEK